MKRRLLLLVSMLALLCAALYAPANTNVTRAADDVCACLCTNSDGTLDKDCYRACIHDTSHPPMCRK